MSLPTLLRTPAVIPLGWTLLHFLWQGALIAMLLAAANAALRRASANARYVAACAALALMLLCAGATFVRLSAGPPPVPEALTAGPASVAAASVPPAMGLPEAVFRFEEYFPWLAALWLAGIVVLSVRSAGAWMCARRLRSCGIADVPPAWEERLRRTSRALGIRAAVRLCTSALAEVPTVVGWLRPVILVPAGAFAGLDVRHLEALLAHELAHIRRHDYLVNLIQTAVETLLFYHPAVWWVGQKIRIERENCCDDIAVSACGNVAVYARALTAVEEMRGGSPRFAMAADGALLLARIRRLLGAAPAANSSRQPCLAAALALVAAFAVWQSAQSRPAVAAVAGGFVAESVEPPAGPVAQAAEPATAAPKRGGFTAGLADAGYPNLTPEQLVAFKRHGVTPEYVRDLKAAGITGLKPDDLVAFRIHGMDAKRIRELRDAGFALLRPDQLMAFQIHGVTPEFAREMKALGIGEPSPDDLVALRIHGVTPRFAADVEALGLGGAGFQQLVAFRIHGLDPGQVRELQALGLGSLTADQVVALRIHNVTPAFVRSLKDAGVAALTVDDAIAASIHGIDARFVQEARKRGLKNPTMDRLLERKLGTAGDDII